MVCATNEGLYARVSSHTTNKLKYEHIDMTTGESKAIEMSLDQLELSTNATGGGFYSYICGTAAAVLNFLTTEALTQLLSAGIYVNNYRTTLPMKKGLSSSAAICVLIVNAFDSLLNLNLTTKEIMELAYKGEMMTPSRCGRMDQVDQFMFV